ncbi:MAG: hypothetical protein JW740_03320 [Candidatus Zambryskibacteria bacterium]|nr:hypothetical protein [Candidatus Zambryskibacteria bacterium]
MKRNIFKKIFNNWGKKYYKEINPDEIFLDSKNLPEFDLHQFEGRLEKPISSRVFPILILICLLVFGVFLTRLSSLQIVQGAFYRERSENNKLKQILLVASRGIIYSRDGIKLAWNEKSNSESEFPLRKYVDTEGFSSLLGFLKYPSKDKAGFYYEEEFVPKDGAELYLNEILSGKNGLKLIEISVNGDIVTQSIIEPPQNGINAVLSVDSRIQSKLFKEIKNLSLEKNFKGGAGVIMDVDSGEILAMTSFPEYDSEVVTEGKDAEKIESYYKDNNNPFLNRTISGLYAPGSIIKPFLAFAALEEDIISPEKQIISTGELIIPNPYDPENPTIFKDWKAHGAVDMKKAIAVSSDVYFYEIGGGFESQEGLGIDRIKEYLEKFNFTKITGFDPEREENGVIPDPEWKYNTFGDIWRLGDTYNTAIGQYGMQITPIQAVVATAALANNGKLLRPSILFTATSTEALGSKIKSEEEHFEIVKGGMRMAVLEGTASGLNIGLAEIAGKTGTAELGSRKQFVNSWVVGFWPYKKPKYAFAVVMERGPSTNLVGATYVMRQLFDWMTINIPEYLKNN